MSTVEFIPWPKTPRLFRDIVITEKIDGTNAAIQIIDLNSDDHDGSEIPEFYYQDGDGNEYQVAAQSRKRLITPDDDNAGFARWVDENVWELIEDLGPGTHFGEWWGQGIQRKYGLDHKRFSLFNTAKWAEAEFVTPDLHVVPVLYEGPFDAEEIEFTLDDLSMDGSAAAPGFMKPEGICIFHTASRQVFKVLLENDDIPKSLAG